MIDRPLRSAFADGFRNEVQVIATVLSADQVHQPDIISIMGASAALMIAGIPFEGPLAGVRVARVDGEFLVNPTFDELEESDLDLLVAGSRDAVYMVEAGAYEVTEEDMLAALEFAMEAIGEFCDVQEQLIAQCDVTPMDVPLHTIDDALRDRVFAPAQTRCARRSTTPTSTPAWTPSRRQGRGARDLLRRGDSSRDGKDIKALLKQLEKKTMRAMVLDEGERADGRGLDEVRQVDCVAGYLPRAHGSGLFTRGQTQVLSVLTLGHAVRVAAPRHDRRVRGQALHPPLQLPAVLHGRDRLHARPQAPRHRPRRPG